jgi:hypothetical protein
LKNPDARHYFCPGEAIEVHLEPFPRSGASAERRHLKFKKCGALPRRRYGQWPGKFLLVIISPAAYAAIAFNLNATELMDIIFNCPECEQELEVDSAGAGSQISCPSCESTITIPQPGTKGTRTSGADSSGSIPVSGVSIGGLAGQVVNPIATSAAAKVEKHLKVPVRATPTESLIAKPLPPLEVAAKDTDKKIRVKTIRRTDCVEVGHDKFDEVVSNFLMKVGEANIINISPMTYTHVDIGSQKILTDYAVMIVFRG